MVHTLLTGFIVLPALCASAGELARAQTVNIMSYNSTCTIRTITVAVVYSICSKSVRELARGAGDNESGQYCMYCIFLNLLVESVLSSFDIYLVSVPLRVLQSIKPCLHMHCTIVFLNTP